MRCLPFGRVSVVATPLGGGLLVHDVAVFVHRLRRERPAREAGREAASSGWLMGVRGVAVGVETPGADGASVGRHRGDLSAPAPMVLAPNAGPPRSRVAAVARHGVSFPTVAESGDAAPDNQPSRHPHKVALAADAGGVMGRRPLRSRSGTHARRPPRFSPDPRVRRRPRHRLAQTARADAPRHGGRGRRGHAARESCPP